MKFDMKATQLLVPDNHMIGILRQQSCVPGYLIFIICNIDGYMSDTCGCVFACVNK